MKYHSLFIKAKFCPEVIERILRVIRHRGFKLYALNTLLYNTPNQQQINIFITVISDKTINLLHTQLNKLIDVNDIIEI